MLQKESGGMTSNSSSKDQDWWFVMGIRYMGNTKQQLQQRRTCWWFVVGIRQTVPSFNQSNEEITSQTKIIALV